VTVCNKTTEGIAKNSTALGPVPRLGIGPEASFIYRLKVIIVCLI